MLADKIRDYRRKNGMTQDGLARAMNVSRSAVSRWENGYGTPDLENLSALADLFAVKVDDLIRDTGEEYRPEPVSKSKRRTLLIAVTAVCCVLLCAVLFISRSLNRLSGLSASDMKTVKLAQYPYSSFSSVDKDSDEFLALLSEMGKAAYAGSGMSSVECRLLCSLKLDSRRYDIMDHRGKWFIYDSGSNRVYSCGSGLIEAADDLASRIDPEHVSYFLGPPEYSDNLDGMDYPVTLEVEGGAGIRNIGYRISYRMRFQDGVLADGRIPAAGDGTLNEGMSYLICSLSSRYWPALLGPKIDYLTFSFYDMARPEEIIGEERVAMFELGEIELHFRCLKRGEDVVVELVRDD